MTPVIVVGIIMAIVAIAMACVSIRDAKRARRVWSEGHMGIHGLEPFIRIEPPLKSLPKRVVLGRLTNAEIQDIELRMREARNLAVGSDPRPWQIATLNDTERLAIVDVARLLAHIRNLEDRK